MKVKIEKICLPYKTPFSITGYTFTGADTVRITLIDKSSTGAGEAYAMGETALGIFYEGETMDSMATQLESVVQDISAGITHDALQELLPYGGARNALDEGRRRAARWTARCLPRRIRAIPAKSRDRL